MLRINLSYLYSLGAAIQQVVKLEDGIKLRDALYIILSAQNYLDSLLTQGYFPIRTSRSNIEACRNILKGYGERQDYEYELTPFDIYTIRGAIQNMETVLNAEFSIADAYSVTQKGGYDTTVLITQAEKLFPDELISLVPKSIPDIREAGKCTAFELPTAAGFHIHRANEAVMRRYFDAVTSDAEHPESRNIEIYLKKMEQLKVGEPKVIAALRDLKDLHRNPLIHPEDNLTKDEALALLGAVLSVVSSMLPAIKRKFGAATLPSVGSGK